jgi:hypothetical protein
MQRSAGGLPLPALAALLLLAGPCGDARAEAPHPASNVDPRLGPLVESAVISAAVRLQTSDCLAVLEEFRDSTTGRPLVERLAETGQSASEYLGRWITYTSGLGLRPCDNSGRLAFTSPGSRVVFVCRDQFLAASRKNNEGYASTILIHEALHSLGLGENPPDSRVITARVQARCGR